MYDNILNFYKEYIKIEQLIRTGWKLRKVPADRIESVGDHTLQLIMLASVITRELDIDIDLKKLMEMLLIHDIGELLIGDVAETDKDRKRLKSNENVSAKEILSSLSDDSCEYYYSLWKEMNERETSIAKFAYLIDKIDAIIKALIYEKEYNMDGLFIEFYNLQKQRGTFNNSILEEFYNFLGEKYKELKSE